MKVHALDLMCLPPVRQQDGGSVGGSSSVRDEHAQKFAGSRNRAWHSRTKAAIRLPLGTPRLKGEVIAKEVARVVIQFQGTETLQGGGRKC